MFVYFYFILSSRILSSNLIVDFVCLKLLQKFRLVELMGVLMKYLLKLLRSKVLLGFKVSLNGRISRRDRATYY
jgi:hypothetical protein